MSPGVYIALLMVAVALAIFFFAFPPKRQTQQEPTMNIVQDVEELVAIAERITTNFAANVEAKIAAAVTAATAEMEATYTAEITKLKTALEALEGNVAPPQA